MNIINIPGNKYHREEPINDLFSQRSGGAGGGCGFS